MYEYAGDYAIDQYEYGITGCAPVVKFNDFGGDWSDKEFMAALCVDMAPGGVLSNYFEFDNQFKS